ncbi:MAG: lysophospholipid acyltransferase family protein [Mycoplasma sp.]
MQKLFNLLPLIGWSLSLPFVWPVLVIKFFIVKNKSKKYQKNPKDFTDAERYTDVYKLVKLTNYVKRVKANKPTGKEKMLNKAQLIVINHKSKYDPMIIYPHCYRQLNNNFVFIAKKELLQSKYAEIFKYVDTIFLDRENLRDAIRVLNEEKELLSKGKSVVVFPEGTRNKGTGISEFKSGAFEPAYKSMCPIQPIVITNTETYDSDSTVKKTPIDIKVMEPIQHHKYITIDRTIFARNLKNSMEKEYLELLKPKVEKKKKEKITQ